MSFSTMLTTDMAMFFNTDEFAVSVTYYPAAGGTVSAKAILGYGEGDFGNGADELDVISEMRLQKSEVATVTAGDEVTISGATWEVLTARLTEDGLEWVCSIHRR